MVKHAQTIRQLLPTNCLNVFDYFVKLALKGLSWYIQDPVKRDNDLHRNYFKLLPNYAVNFLHLTTDAICSRLKCQMQNMRPLIARVTSLSECRHTLIILTCFLVKCSNSDTLVMQANTNNT